MHDLLSLNAQTRGDRVHQLKRTDSMSQTEPARCIDIFRACDILLDQSYGFDDERMQHAIDRKSDHVLNKDRHLAKQTAMRQCQLDSDVVGPKCADDFHELHSRDRRKEMCADEPL